MKLTHTQKTELIAQLNYWKMLDNIEHTFDGFNAQSELSDQEESEYKKLRQEIDEILESWSK
jgi:hypothetical protein